jgi:molybdopterin-containing oxidoreductase family iron-sulfur binding subunit
MRAKDTARLEHRNPRQLREGDDIPACAESCPSRAIAFGDLLNPTHRVHQLSKSKYAFRLLERLGTEPQVYYLSKREWVRRQGDNYLPDEPTRPGN